MIRTVWSQTPFRVASVLMSIGKTLLRWLALWSLVFWIGGFTFYGGVVIPVLHDQLGSALEAGLVTQRVTDLLNLLGLYSDCAGLDSISPGTTGRPAWPTDRLEGGGRDAGGPLALPGDPGAASTVGSTSGSCSGEMAGFYPLHRAYLWASTLQWCPAWCCCRCGPTGEPAPGPMPRTENPQVSG